MNNIFVKLEKLPVVFRILILIMFYIIVCTISVSLIVLIINFITRNWDFSGVS